MQRVNIAFRIILCLFCAALFCSALCACAPPAAEDAPDNSSSRQSAADSPEPERETPSATPESGSPKAYEGGYKLYSVLINQDEYIGDSADEVLRGASGCVLNVSGGVFSMNIGGEQISGVYEEDGENLILYEDGSPFPTAVEGTRLIMDLTDYSGSDIQYIFVKL